MHINIWGWFVYEQWGGRCCKKIEISARGKGKEIDKGEIRGQRLRQRQKARWKGRWKIIGRGRKVEELDRELDKYTETVKYVGKDEGDEVIVQDKSEAIAQKVRKQIWGKKQRQDWSW